MSQRKITIVSPYNVLSDDLTIVNVITSILLVSNMIIKYRVYIQIHANSKTVRTTLSCITRFKLELIVKSK